MEFLAMRLRYLVVIKGAAKSTEGIKVVAYIALKSPTRVVQA
jgi:hypothetical protein